jgi:peptidoglycan/xylan/chitin deacetylase (PgdA/CDA1 family)
MNPLRRVLLWAVARLGGLRVARLIANVFEPKKSANGDHAFPFIKRRRSTSVQILVYHRVNDENDPIFPGVPTKAFAEQMEYVAEHYAVCSLSETVQRLRSNDLPAGLLTITFDDGYRDNCENAFPILNRLSLPATIFLATGAVDSGRMLWHDRVFSALRDTRATALQKFGDNGQMYPLNTPAAKQHALVQVLKFLWSLDDSDRSLWVERLIQKLAIEEPMSGERLMLSWDEIRAMSEHQISFGAHTVTHPILSKIPPRQLKQEIRESKEIIESHLKTPVTHFAYPVGRREDFTAAVKKELHDAGFESAATTIFGANDSKQDLLELRRATPWGQDIDSFALRLSYFKFAST